MNNKKHIIAAIAVIAVGLAAFFGGLTMGKGQAKASSLTPQTASGVSRFGGQGGVAGAAGFSRGSNLRGSVLSMEDGSMIVQLADSQGTKIVMLGKDTQILETKATTADALTAGKSVTIMGTANTDGTFLATNVMLREAGTEPTLPPPSTPDSTTPTSEAAQ
jgi:hypothetical protein